MADIVASRLQPMLDRYTLIEHEAFAFPAAFFRGHRLQIFQNPALEMIDVFQALGLHESRRLLATDSARAEHGDLGLATLR